MNYTTSAGEPTQVTIPRFLVRHAQPNHGDAHEGFNLAPDQMVNAPTLEMAVTAVHAIINRDGEFGTNRWDEGRTIEIMDLYHNAVVARVEFDETAHVLRLVPLHLSHDGTLANLGHGYHGALLVWGDPVLDQIYHEQLTQWGPIQAI